jgi:FHA domain
VATPFTPYMRIEDTGVVVELRPDVTTIGRGEGVDVRLEDASVSRLHAELVRRGNYVYVSDLGLSANGTRVNGRPVGRRVLAEGDVVTFGLARCRLGGLSGGGEMDDDTVEVRRVAAPELTRRELEVLTALCRPALQEDAFVAPASAREIGDELVVTEAAVKQHLLRLYQKFRISEGVNRRARLANEIVSAGIVKPLPASDDARVRRAG